MNFVSLSTWEYISVPLEEVETDDMEDKVGPNDSMDGGGLRTRSDTAKMAKTTSTRQRLDRNCRIQRNIDKTAVTQLQSMLYFTGLTWNESNRNGEE